MHCTLFWGGAYELSSKEACRRDSRSRQARLTKAFLNGILELVSLLDRGQRSVQFYEQQLRTLQQGSEKEQGCSECSICLDPMSDLTCTAILPCSHLFHMQCVREALARTPHCPECRAPLRLSEISSVVMELKSPEPLPPTPQAPMTRAWKRHGSKLNAVAAKLKQIREQDPTAKARVLFPGSFWGWRSQERRSSDLKRCCKQRGSRSSQYIRSSRSN